MRKAPTLKALQKIVDQFNADYPVGTPVILKKDTGVVQTVVDSPAEILGGHSAVGWFRGVRGCYAIDGRVSPLCCECGGSGKLDYGSGETNCPICNSENPLANRSDRQ